MPVSRLSANDLTNLATDHGSVPMQIGAAIVLDEESAPDAEELVGIIEQRLARVPRLGQRLCRPPVGAGRPYWEPAPLGAAGLVTSAAGLPDDTWLVDAAVERVLRRLPRDRPLWRAVVYTDPAGRALGLVVVMHHVLADGIGGLAVLAELVDTDGDATRRPDGATGTASPDARAIVRDAWSRRWDAVRSAPTTLRGLAAGLRELGGLPRPDAAPTSLLQPTSARRRVDLVDVDLAGLVNAAHARDATVNDLLLVAVSGALRRLLVSRGEQLDEVVISIPVSARRAASAADLGNQVGVLPVKVPLDEDASVRLTAVRDQRARLGTAAPRASSGAVLSVLFRGLAAVGLFQWFVRRQRLVHTFVTNLHGPAEPLTLAGSRVRRLVPISTAPGNVTLSFDVLSYAGRLVVAVVHDPDHVPDHAVIRDALEDELTRVSDQRA